MERRDVGNATGDATFRAVLTIGPSNRTFRSSWQATGKEAKQDAAARALAKRLGDVYLGCPRSALNEVLTAALGRTNNQKLLELETQELEEGAGFRSEAKLPAELFAPEAPPEVAAMEGQGASKRAAEQAAAHAALLYVCKALAVLPVLKALKDTLKGKSKKKKSAPGRGSRTVVFQNVGPKTDKDALRKRFEQYGSLESFSLNGSSAGKGSAAFEHPLSAWVAQRMLSRAVIDEHVLSVEQQGMEAKSKPPAKSVRQMSFGKTTGIEGVLYYTNAPFQESFSSMLKHFNKVGTVEAFRYWVDGKTGASRGMGTVSYGSAQASEKALEQLQGMEIGGRKLVVRPYQKHQQEQERSAEAAAAVASAIAATTQAGEGVATGASSVVEA